MFILFLKPFKFDCIELVYRNYQYTTGTLVIENSQSGSYSPIILCGSKNPFERNRFLKLNF